MQSFRRVALRSAVSAARTAAPKAPSTSFASQLGKHASGSRICLLSIGRYFSQTARVAESSVPESQVGNETETESNSNSNAQPALGADETPYALFIRNMSFDVTPDHLHDIFGKYGTVTKATIARDPRGLSRGFGFVWLSSAEEAALAMAEVNGTFWQGRLVHVAPKTSPSSEQTPQASLKQPTRYLYIGNIPFESTDAELNRVFKGLENVENIRVAIDRVTGWPRGFAHADFTDVESAKRGLAKLRGMQIGNRTIRVDYAGPARTDLKGQTTEEKKE